jgi:hypothetical protein
MTVVLPPRLTASAETLRGAAHQRGLRTVRLPTFELPAGLRAENVHAGPSVHPRAQAVDRVRGRHQGSAREAFAAAPGGVAGGAWG